MAEEPNWKNIYEELGKLDKLKTFEDLDKFPELKKVFESMFKAWANKENSPKQIVEKVLEIELED